MAFSEDKRRHRSRQRRALVWGLSLLLAAGCAAPPPGPRETYLGEFWAKWYGSTEYDATRIDHGNGIYEDSYRERHPRTQEGECTTTRYVDSIEVTYRGLVLIIETEKSYRYNSCLDDVRVYHMRTEYDYSPNSPEDIYDALMSGKSMSPPVHAKARVIGYDCAVEATVCDLDNAIRIRGAEGEIDVVESYSNLDSVPWIELESGFDSVPWKGFGEGVVELPSGRLNVIVFDWFRGRNWYDPEHEVIVLKGTPQLYEPSFESLITIDASRFHIAARRLGGPPPERGVPRR